MRIRRSRAHEVKAAGLQVSPLVMFHVVRRETGSESLATASVIACGYRVEGLLTDGLSSQWFQQRLKDSHLQFRAAGFTDDDLPRLGYAL